MPTYDDIVDQINELPNSYIFYTKKEIKRLPNLLTEGEQIRALTSGFADYRTVLCVTTNKRIIFLDRGMFFGQRQRQMTLDKVQSVVGDYLVFFGTITVSDGSSSMAANMVLASSIDPYVQATNAAMDEFRTMTFREIAHNATRTGSDIASQIERLAALKEAGHLTEEEFEKQKERLLGE